MAPSLFKLAAIVSAYASAVLAQQSGYGEPPVYQPSTTLSTRTTTRSNAPTASALCPGNNGTTFTAADGEQFIVECGVDRYGADLGLVYTLNFQACMDQCSITQGCDDVSYLPGNPSPCYLKNGIRLPVGSSKIDGARVVAPGNSPGLHCPFDDGKQYKTYVPGGVGPDGKSGRTYQIECNTDHYDSDYKSNPIQVQTLEDCVTACDAKTGCQAAVFTGIECYLKYSVGSSSYKPGLSSARCISGCQNQLTGSGY